MHSMLTAVNISQRKRTVQESELDEREGSVGSCIRGPAEVTAASVWSAG